MNRFFVNMFLFLLVFYAFLFAQGTPHTMYGTVYNEGGTYPVASCLAFKVFIVGKPDTLFYPADYPTVNYVESSGNWIAEISSLNEQDGDIVVVIFENACSSYVGYDTALVDLSGPSQDMGIVFLSHSAGCVDSRKVKSLDVQITPTPFNGECEIDITGEGKVSVKVFNVLGQMVEKVCDEVSSGSLVLKWKPENLPAGIYFVKVKIDSSVITRRVFYQP